MENVVIVQVRAYKRKNHISTIHCFRKILGYQNCVCNNGKPTNIKTTRQTNKQKHIDIVHTVGGCGLNLHDVDGTIFMFRKCEYILPFWNTKLCRVLL
jgi:hypothetical protein